jgi:FixJ family two-component response regulator
MIGTNCLSNPISSPTIFVVDDDALVRSALVRLLRSGGFRVAAFASAEDFLDYRQVGYHAVLILDVRMPRMSGLQLQKRLQENGVTIPIVFLSAFEDPQVRSEALAAGASDFLHKSVDEKVLFAGIKKALGNDVEKI